MSVTSSFLPGGVGGVYDFSVNGADPYTELKVYVNGTDYTKLVAPAPSYNIVDPLITDKTGSVQGKLTVIRTYGNLSSSSDLDVIFYNAENNNFVSKLTIPSGAISPDSAVNSTRNSIIIAADSSSSSSINVNSASKLGGILNTLNPLTQTFFVDATKYPDGIFVTTIKLYFSNKDSTMPVAVQLRKVLNGVPSSTEIIDNSTAIKTAAGVNLPVVALGDAVATSFTVFCRLPPGEYGLSVITDSPEYNLYSAQFGGTVTKEPYVGKLFKAQNTNTWIEEQNTCICFDLKKAVFATGVSEFNLTSQIMPLTRYDSIYLDSTHISVGDSSYVSYAYSGKGVLSGTMSSLLPIKSNSPIDMDATKKAQTAQEIRLSVTLQNSSKDISPILDRSKLTLFTFRNEIDPYDLDTRNSELQPNNGVAKSRYISRIITLANDFDSTGLEIKLDVNRKIGTDIDVFCRVMSSQDINIENNIEKLAWRRMPIFNQRATATNPNSLEGEKLYAGTSDRFYTETYKILEEDSEATTGISNLYYNAFSGNALITFKSFNKYQIKVVMYSQDTTIVPKIKNIIATAVI